MVEFIRKLKTGMYMREAMNAILEHIGVLQVNSFYLKFSFFFMMIIIFFV
jgi:hypothetical protein